MKGSDGAFAEIVAVEQAMRSLAEVVLESAMGVDWFKNSGLSELRIAKALERQEEEAKSRDGAVADESLVRYLDIFDIGTIVRKNWEVFKPVLDDRKKFDVYWARLEHLRVSLAHGRELLPFEESLVLGMAGELRNVVTIYRSEMDPSGQYYPAIESVRDSFGNEWTPGSGLPIPSVTTRLRIDVGQELEFRCRGWDPQSRELTWVLEVFGFGTLATATGNEAVLPFRAREEDVGEHLYITIRMKSSGKYHRASTGWDDRCEFEYAVNPPDAHESSHPTTP